MYQKLIMIGNLGQDPEMRFTPNGTPVTNFSIATNRKYKGADGISKTETLWVRVTVWGKQAETCNQYLTKGQQVLVEGTLTADEKGNPRIWTGQDGKPRTGFEMRADVVRFLSKAEGQPDNAGGADQEEELPF